MFTTTFLLNVLLGTDCFWLQPVRIIDPHLVSTFYDDYERAYLHVTAELENKSTWSADCSVNIQVTAELENGVCLVEHLHTENVLIPARGNIHHTFKPVSGSFIILLVS